ncbi:cation transporter [Neptuniibacter sp. QD72_48]|uniref:cation transporter n=1 Tax=unclassified Neptuniibacter TaxID=2630693 RepID=UPI0039F6CA6E
MADSCCNANHSKSALEDGRFRRALWIALWINASMFIIEIIAGFNASSASLLADAIDFLGDSANYAISLSVLSMGMLWRSRAALIKGSTMLLFGIAVLLKVLWDAFNGQTPEPVTMGIIGLLALVANVTVAIMLYTFRSGDADMRSVWLCSRNDAIGNVAVMIAAAGVLGSGQAWPDLLVATIMGLLATSAGISVIKQARQELNTLPRESCS